MTRMRIIALISTALAAALVLTACAPTDGVMPGMNHGSSGMSTDAAADHNAADQMFLTMMIPHHQQAIEMADVVLAKDDVDPEVVGLADQIKDAQGPEIEAMQGWLEAWGLDDHQGAMDGMGHGDGMMSGDDMAALDAAEGSEASRLFLEQMILHHQGAIEMAQTEVESGENTDAVGLAEQIIRDQTAEIATMRELLGQL